MPHTSYADLLRQIETLKGQAETARRREMAGVIARIKEAISAYGLTVTDLFGTSSAKQPGAYGTKRVAAKVYSDGQGHEWRGMGKRPRWLVDALAAGRDLQDFVVASGRGTDGDAAKQAALGTPRSSKKAAKGKQRVSKHRYSDGSGNSWSGMGRKPGWFVDALAGGKTLEDLTESP